MGLAPPHKAEELNAIIVKTDLFSACSFTIAFLLEGGAGEGDTNPTSFTWSDVRAKIFNDI